jgi:erythromycin esterase-like protein
LAKGAAQTIAAAAQPVRGAADDHAELLRAAGPATRILLGESTHGTHEFYRERARLTERLVLDHGVNAVAIEGDWSPTYRANLYVRGLGKDRSAAEALRGCSRFPEWMWRNAEFQDFVERLRAINMTRAADERIGLYGMDVYDMFEAADAVVAYLRESSPAAANRAGAAYRCFTRSGRTTAEYGEATLRGADCSGQAAAGVAAVARLPRPADPVAAERHFAAVRSAASVAAAEEYFRTAYRGSLAWNVRDGRMARNVEEIAAHVQALSGRPGKVVMWSHNTHSGDARATFAANRGELNLGQLMRQRHGQAAFLVGFFTYEGTVFAAPDWDRPGRVYTVRPALPGSYAALFRSAGQPNFTLLLRGNAALGKTLGGPMLERAIGVVYRPETERSSHYFEARLAEQFDAAIFFDRSRAVTPLPR